MLPESDYSRVLRGQSKRTYAKNERSLLMRIDGHAGYLFGKPRMPPVYRKAYALKKYPGTLGFTARAYGKSGLRKLARMRTKIQSRHVYYGKK